MNYRGPANKGMLMPPAIGAIQGAGSEEPTLAGLNGAAAGYWEADCAMAQQARFSFSDPSAETVSLFARTGAPSVQIFYSRYAIELLG